MSFKLSDLLNPTSSRPASPKVHSSQAQGVQSPDAIATLQTAERRGSTSAYPATTLYEAADVLTALANSGPLPSGSFAFGRNEPFPPHDQYAPPAPYPQARRTSSYGSIGVPVEPSSVEHVPHQSSPSLEQYHHGSRSPEEQRRQSLFSIPSNPTVLPPIHSLDSITDRRQSSDQVHPQLASPAPYGHDTSQIVATSSNGSARRASQLSPNTIAQTREPDYVRDEPTTTQIRAPSPQVPIADITSKSLLTSSPPQIKLEPSAPSREATPARAANQTEQQGNPSDSETLKAINDLKNEHGLRGASREASSATALAGSSAMEATTTTSPSTTKKRKPVNSVVKRGGGGKKATSKKRKTEGTDASGSTGRPSPTPSSRTSKPKAKKSQSGTPVAGSSPPSHIASSPAPQTIDDEEEYESGSDDGIYCICRKGDNHTWMIACDGSCQDWYHGNCVNVKESDGDLIEKYYCPKCTAAGEGHTTWKRMCRREGCRKPARRGEQSKYCSDECGVKFFADMVGNLRGSSQSTSGEKAGGRSRRDRRKANQTDQTSNAGEDEDEDVPLGPRGGVVSARDLKALTVGARDVDHFKNLGNSMLSPPATVSPTQTRFPHRSSTSSNEDADVPLPTPDAQSVAEIQAEIAALKERVGLLKDRGRFVEISRDQATRFAEREGVKPKDICGYDARLAWSEGEFQLWRTSKQGKAALRQASLEAQANGEVDDDGDVKMDGVDGVNNSNGEVNGDTKINGADSTTTATTATTSKPDPDPALLQSLQQQPELCPKKRCQRHAQWLKISSYDVQFELAQARQQIADLDAEEREIRNRALVRWRNERAETVDGNGDTGAGTEAERTGVNTTAGAGAGGRAKGEEGWVEVLG